MSYHHGPHIGHQFMSWILFCFLLPPFAETLLMLWAHGIEDTNALDVIRYYFYLVLQMYRFSTINKNIHVGLLENLKRDFVEKGFVEKKDAED